MVKDWFWVCIGFALIVYLVVTIALNSFADHFLGDHPKYIKAEIISEKNYEGNQPVNPKFTYSYRFTVDGEVYKGNSHNEDIPIGDSVEIVYNAEHPWINKPLHPLN